jgi:hypothetical protein
LQKTTCRTTLENTWAPHEDRNTMGIWQVTTDGDQISFGGLARKKIKPSGCNEPFKDHFWCPERKWFSKDPCPFLNRRECLNYKRMCGSN